MQDVIVVQQGDELTGGHLDALVGIAGDQLILFQFLIPDAGVCLGAGQDVRSHFALFSGIHAAEFPVLVGLVHHRVQQLFQKIQRGVVQRHNDADLRAGGLLPGLLYQQLHRCKAVGAHGVAREEGRILPLGAGVFPDAGNAVPAQLAQQDEQREGAPDLAALADDIAHGPGQLPEPGVDHLVQGRFQIVRMAAAEGEVAAEPLDEGGLLTAGALGPDHPVPQDIQLFLIACDQIGLRGLYSAEQCRLLCPAPAPPPEIPVPAPGRQGFRPALGRGAVGKHQQHLPRQGIRHLGPGRVFHHQQVRLPVRSSRPGVGPDPGPAQAFFQRLALRIQHRSRLRGQFLRNALCQQAAALHLLLCFL